MQQSPNSLQARIPANSMSKRPLYIAVGVVLILVCALLYALEDSERRKKEPPPSVNVDERSLVPGQGAGVILPPIAPPPEPEPPPKLEEKKPVVVVMQGETEDQDAEELRKRRRQQLLNALGAPVVGKKLGSAGSPAASQSAARERNTSDSPLVAGRSSEYDPAEDIDKEGFFTRADTGDAGWLSRHTREAGRLLEIKTGTVIPAVMVSGINSDLPGVMIAQVSQNVFNTATGQYLLIPQGAKLYGVYDSRVAYGQERVLVAWNRIVFPDGSSVTLGAMPGADMGGYAGFHDLVNNHYLRIFGSAFLMSAIIGTTAYVVDDAGRNDNSDKTSFRDEMVTALAQQMGQAAMQLLQKNLSINPTLEIRPGYRFNVVLTKDVAFAEPYVPHTYGAKP